LPLILKCIVVLLLTAPELAVAQRGGPGPTLQGPVESLEEGQWVRIAGDFGRGEGQVLAHSTRQLTLSSHPMPLRVPATSIDTVWTRGRGTGKGALIGGLIGLGLGAVFATQWDLEDTPPEAVWGLALGAGAVGGTLVGVAIGSGVHVYKRRYP
jgi:hypothetical protein